LLPRKGAGLQPARGAIHRRQSRRHRDDG